MSSIGSLHRLLELGRGGMARVWLAVSTGASGFRKLVVVKQLRPEFTRDARVREMFLEEARLAAKLNHPNTVQTIEVAEQDGEFFIVMEYLDGQPLDAIQRQGPVPLAATLAILAEVCAGLHHAHELRDLDGTPLDVVHRDVSPQNVFVTYSGQVKVVDFGIAKTLISSGVSQAGEIKGKIGYMAREQALGLPVDRRADIFSVGVMLYSALSGRRLWDGTPENKIIERLRSGDIPKLVLRPSGLNAPPAELVAVCNKCIAPAARDRYETAQQVQVALEHYAKANGGMYSRGELGSFLSRGFEEHRLRRQSVIEEKVRLLSEGNLLTNSVKRQPSTPPPAAPPRVAGKLPRPTPPPLRRAPQPPQPVNSAVAASQVEAPDRVSRVPTERPLPSHVQHSAPKPTWTLPEGYEGQTRISASSPIFVTKDKATQRRVAVQLLPGELRDEQVQQRFAHAALLRHPNTVRLIDVGVIKGAAPVTYVVRENVVGQSLAERLMAGPLDITDALRIGTQVLDSLTEAHERGLVHGRLSPSHVLLEGSTVTEATRARVLGYWASPAAARLDDDVAYHEPSGAAITTQSDLYAVGQLIHAAIYGGPRTSRSLITDLEPRLAALLNRSLERDPSRRFATAKAMLEALRRVDWTSATRGDVLARDRHFFGATPTDRERRLAVARNELLSKRPPSVWIFDGEPSIARSRLLAALSELRGQLEVRQLGDADRDLAYEELSTGKVSLPWVVVFGPLHVVLADPLLHLLRTTPEVSRLLVSPAGDFELLHTSVNSVGLDGQIFESAEKEEVATALAQMIARTRQISQAYDAVRVQLLRARDELGQRSRELTAIDAVR